MNKKSSLFKKLLIIFTLVPLVELFLLYKLSSLTSWYITLIIVIGTGFLGAYLAKKEGLGVISRIKTNLSVGKIPGYELVDGLCILIGSAFLLTPGILTDIVGFTLVIPTTRIFYCKLLNKLISRFI